MKALGFLLVTMGVLAIISPAYAYFNLTSTNTTVILSSNQSAHVVETFLIYVSNSSATQYAQYKNTIGQNLSYWQKVLFTTSLQEHILGAGYSVSGFELLAGPLQSTSNGGYATMTMNYYVNNLTTAKNIAPRTFEYTFNNIVFNFENTGSGQVIPPNTRFNIVIPTGAQAVSSSVYPQPDYPRPDITGGYTNVTEFSWYSGEPLSNFAFEYIVTESPQAEVLSYFTDVYTNHRTELYIIIAVVVVLLGLYLYLKRQGK